MIEPQVPEQVPRLASTRGRIVLRAFTLADAEPIEVLINDPAVAAGTLTIPHPYPKGGATPWIEAQVESAQMGRSYTWAITSADDGRLLGAVSLRLTLKHLRAELGYWVAKREWGNGFASDAVRTVIAFAFDDLGLHRVDAHHFIENPASGKVMRKAGMRSEGIRRGAVFRFGVPKDLEEYAILRSDPRG